MFSAFPILKENMFRKLSLLPFCFQVLMKLHYDFLGMFSRPTVEKIQICTIFED